jgi:NhaA family Na+:H+ antiporter
VNDNTRSNALRLRRPVDLARDRYRGGGDADAFTLVLYGDYLCPYCRRLRFVLANLRQTLGSRFLYVFRHFPNERVHPGADFLARAAEAASRQDHFWEMHDWIYAQDPPLAENDVLAFASSLGLDMRRFHRDLESEETRRRVDEDLTEGKRNGVAGTPTVFIDGIRYDGAWDFYSMLEALERPVATRLQRSARAFASLPASGGAMLLLAAAAALLCANTPLASYYSTAMNSEFGIGPSGNVLTLSIGAWFSEGLLGIFFLLVGLEIRREITAGALSDLRAAALPIIAAVGGVLAPAAIYLLLNRGPATVGWAVPTATDIAFTLGILALMGSRAPAGLRVFVAALAVADDVISVLTLAIFYPHEFDPLWLGASIITVLLLFAMNRARVYFAWPYAVATVGLGLFLHSAGVHAALAGVILAGLLPVRPAPSVGPLLAQAANALAALEQAEADAQRAGGEVRRIEQEPIWDWASRNLSAATDRLLSPADRIERAVAPWSAYVILPLFAFSATGVGLRVDISTPESRSILIGVILGLVVGKPVGIVVASWAATKARLARMPGDVSLQQFIGGACLCGVGYTMAMLIVDQAFPPGPTSEIAKIGVLVGSGLAAALGSIILAVQPRTQAMSPMASKAT